MFIAYSKSILLTSNGGEELIKRLEKEKNVKVLEFDEKILEGDAYIKGTVRGLHLLIVICNLFFDKNIKTTYKAIKNWKG